MTLDTHQVDATIPSMSKILETLRKAVEKGPKTRYQLAKETGLEQAALCRFVHGQTGLTVESVELLAAALGLEIVIRPKDAGKGR